MEKCVISFLLLCVLLLPEHSYADYCLTYYSNNINTYYMYCADGCCGYSHDRKCCNKINSGAIAGGVIGALLAIAIVAGVIVYCYMSKKKKKKKEEEEIEDGFEFNINHPYMGYGLPPAGEPEPGYLNQGFPGAPLGPPPAYDHPPPAPMATVGARGGPDDLSPHPTEPI